MDRSDEFDREARPAERVQGSEERTGDVLGLGGAAVPKTAGDPSAEQDPESIAKRRSRMREEGDEGSGVTVDRSPGATGIDMGSGGSGTDIK